MGKQEKDGKKGGGDVPTERLPIRQYPRGGVRSVKGIHNAGFGKGVASSTLKKLSNPEMSQA